MNVHLEKNPRWFSCRWWEDHPKSEVLNRHSWKVSTGPRSSSEKSGLEHGLAAISLWLGLKPWKWMQISKGGYREKGGGPGVQSQTPRGRKRRETGVAGEGGARRTPWYVQKSKWQSLPRRACSKGTVKQNNQERGGQKNAHCLESLFVWSVSGTIMFAPGR